MSDFLNLLNRMLSYIAVGISHHAVAFEAGGGALGIAAVVTMPEQPPGFFKHIMTQEMWTWCRNALQTAIPAARQPRGQEAHIITSQETAQGVSSKSDATFPVATNSGNKGEV